MGKTLYLDDLAKEVAVKIGKPATQTKRLVKIFEETIALELKAKDRVKLQNFGTFYLIHQQSRHIIQIRTKQRRILIGTTLIKFRPSLKVKQKVNARDEEEVLKIVQAPAATPSPKVETKPPEIIPIKVESKTPTEKIPLEPTPVVKIEQIEPEETPIKIRVVHDKIKSEPELTKTPEPTKLKQVTIEEEEEKPKKEATTEIKVDYEESKPQEIIPQIIEPETPELEKPEPPPPPPPEYKRVDTQKVRSEILRRIGAIKQTSPNSDELLFRHHILETTSSGKLFDLAFKRIKCLGANALNFYIMDDAPNCTIHFGKPRKKLSEIPKSRAVEFLSNHLELDIFDFPQERFVKLYSSSKMDYGWVVFVHSLPLAEGVSVYVRLVKEL